jgi:uncharacterized protein (TIGR02001 family)
MRVRVGWAAAIGLASAASPALAKAETSLVQDDSDPFDALVPKGHFEPESFSDFDLSAFLSAPDSAQTEMTFGSSDWNAMIQGLADAAVFEEPAAERDRNFLPELGSVSTRLAGASEAKDKGGDDPSESAFDISATLTGVSDYRFRGLSLSGRDPALQGSLEVEHETGFYAGVWGSTISELAGAHTEVDIYGGWRGEMGSLGLDAGVTGYLYPGGHGVDYYELTGSASYAYGPAELKLGIAYAPKQANLGKDDSVYVYSQAKLAIPATPVTLVAQVGREEGALEGVDGTKWDWSLGAQVVKDRFTLGLSYVDTNTDRLLDPDKVAHAGVVLSLSISI